MRYYDKYIYGWFCKSILALAVMPVLPALHLLILLDRDTNITEHGSKILLVEV